MRRIGRFVVFALLLAIAGYLVWDRIESTRYARDVAAIEARGEPVRSDDVYPEPRTAEEREAADLYVQAAGLAMEQAAEDNHLVSRLDLDKPGGAELSLPDIVAAYRADASALQLLDRATPLDFGGLGAENRQLLRNQVPLMALGGLACLRADLAALRNDGDAAATALVPCVGLQRTLRSSYRPQHSARLLGSLRILFRHTQPSDGSLLMLQRAWESWPDEDAVLRSVLEARARIIQMVEGGDVPPLVRFFFHPLMMRSARRALASYEPAIAIARQPWQDRWAAVAEIERAHGRRDPPRPPGFVARLVNPVPIGFTGMGLTLSARELAARRTAVAVLAAERYRRSHAGAAPASLEALVPAFLAAVPEDPFSGKALLYRKDAEGYLIYSVDSDRRDDGGSYYGHGAAIAKHMGPQSPRDLGIRVPLTPQRH